MARPNKIKSRKQLQKLVDGYFNSRNGRPLTTAGLALACGFNSRQTLYNYRKDGEYKDIIDNAIARIEEFTEECLYDKNTARGAEFSLKYNFRWGENTAGGERQERNVVVLGEIKEELLNE